MKNCRKETKELQLNSYNYRKISNYLSKAQ